jgi:putative transposase
VKRYLRKLSCVNAAVFAPSPGADDNQKLFCNVVVVCGSTDILIEPGSPRENGYCERFNSKLRDEFLNGEIFYSLKEVQVQLIGDRDQADHPRTHMT